MQESLLQSNDIKLKLSHDLISFVHSYAKDNSCSVEDVMTLALGKLKTSLKPRKASRTTHYRLDVFLAAYESKTGLKYVIGDYSSHCGAAARTVSKVSDDEWGKIVNLYLSSQESRVKQAGYPFLWLIRDLNRWFRESSNEKQTGWAEKLKDLIKGKL